MSHLIPAVESSLDQHRYSIGIGLAYVLAIEIIIVRLLSGFSADWLTSIEKLLLGQNATALIE